MSPALMSSSELVAQANAWVVGRDLGRQRARRNTSVATTESVGGVNNGVVIAGDEAAGRTTGALRVSDARVDVDVPGKAPVKHQANRVFGTGAARACCA